MKFSKTYSQLLLTLPQELQDNAIEYRQLKKLINNVVLELTSLGLSPEVLHGLLHSCDQEITSSGKGKERAFGERPEECQLHSNADDNRNPHPSSRAVYEFVQDGDRIAPRLRLWVATANLDQAAHVEEIEDSRVAIFLDKPESVPSSPVSDTPSEDLLLVSKPVVPQKGQSLIWSLQRRSSARSSLDETWNTPSPREEPDTSSSIIAHSVELVRKKRLQTQTDGTRELIVPLASDTAFFQLLQGALVSLSDHLDSVKDGFTRNLRDLARAISNTARPVSSVSSSFHPASSSSDPSDISAGGPLLSPFSSAFVPGGKGNKSDLYAWREIFQLYVESEVFEGLSERDRGERSHKESEKRLALFAERVTGRGLGDSRKLKLKQSRDALEAFLQLNVLILNLRKFQSANAEAARKILKKHAKRTALPIPSSVQLIDTTTIERSSGHLTRETCLTTSQKNILSLLPMGASSLPHLLVQAIGETLIPIIPHLDDYSCLICTSIAFKPIRLSCGHLFCVRCLVKMQKRGQDHCPFCRSLVVLKADRSNVDWALLNFMQDWFPKEARAKLKQNEREAAQEELEEMGISDQRCVVM